MSQLPVAASATLGRVFDTDWSIANVATLLRANAGRGVWQEEAGAGSRRIINQNYLRTASARHLPSKLSVIFLRLPKYWYASLCFDEGWNAEVAELWLKTLFGEDRALVVEGDRVGDARQFTLAIG
jgi:hypothetical protein